MRRFWVDGIGRFVIGSVLVVATALCLAALLPERAHAYEYLRTDTATTYNRCFVTVNEDGYVEFIGSDPHSMTRFVPSWDEWGGWYYRVVSYQFHVASAASLNWTPYSAFEGSWSRHGAAMGHGVYDRAYEGAANGTGFGCFATRGYGFGGYILGNHGGFDQLMYCHVYIQNTAPKVSDGSGRNMYYGAVDFWPRVRIQYDVRGGIGAAEPHLKYIGHETYVSSQAPTRVGYTFEGWSTSPNGPVNVRSGQKVGAEDWNLKKFVSVPGDWVNGPASFYDEPAGGQPSPSGSNVITLYAQWKPISYAVAYEGNGATEGSTPDSAHVYDAPKKLSPNGFARTHTLTCDAQGGSAGAISVPCAWDWASWNERPDGSGASYGNEAVVKNLRSSPGEVKLHAQWKPGTATLPDPGAKPSCVFKGWYSAASGGELVGGVGDAVTIDRDTTCYARWEQLAKVSYFVDGASALVYEEEVPAGTAYAAASEAAAKGRKDGCAGFDGWYVDVACTHRYVDGAALPASGMALYGRNEVTLSYAPADKTRELVDQRACFVDEALSVPLAAGAPLPPSQTLHYGDRVSLTRGASIWFEDRGRAREAVCDPGAYATSEATGTPARTIKLTGNTVAYLKWRVSAYDGIALS